MELRAFHSTDHALIDRLVERFRPGCPFCDEDGNRIGSVLRAWRKRDNLMVDVECIPENLAGPKTVYVMTDHGFQVFCKIDRE